MKENSKHITRRSFIGTTGAVAAALGRNFILIDQNPEALAVMRSRFAPLEGAVRFE